jgi:hypothetical protein
VDRYSFIVEDLHLLLLAGLPGALRVALMAGKTHESSTFNLSMLDLDAVRGYG